MSHKKDRMKTSKLSSTVLDYYYKYGQNRDLEKYLRMKRSTSKSSSDSSLRNYESSNYTADSKRIAKSMDKLDLSDGKSKPTDDSGRRTVKSTEDVCESGDGPKEKPKSNEKNQIKIEKKTQQQFKSKSKSKSYNLNLESSIEINLPSSTSMPTLPTTQTIDSIPKRAQIPKLESSGTQTNAFLSKPMQRSTSVQVASPSSAKAIVKSEREQMKKTQDSIQETSPASSVASAKVRLEWDSMADIGYNRIIDFKSQSNSNLTTFEKSALTKFFAKRGLNFDDNFLILAPADNKSPLQKREFTQSAIEMREAQRIRKELPKLSPSTSKKLWETALEKYREKYRKSKSDATSGIDTTHFMSLSTAPHHSTPLPIDTSNSGRFSDEPSNHEIQKPIESKPGKPQVELIEKWCQTSSIDVEAIGIQVEQPQFSRISRSVQYEIEQVHESTQKDDEDLTTATSFEFLAPNAYTNRQMAEQLTPILNKSAADEIPNRKEVRNESIYIQDENPDEKENIPPMNDKENIPPLPLHAMQCRNDQPSAYKTPENTIDNNESSVLPNDLQKGVDLINALIDSCTNDTATKKKLIRKIVRHLIKSKDTKDITQMIMSYSGKSMSKISGVGSLDLKESEQSGADMAANDTISGISALSSSSSVASASVEHSRMPVNSRQEKKVDGKKGKKEKEQGVEKEEEEEKKDEKEEQIEQEEDINEEREIKDWLLPVTQSEIEKENARKSQIIQAIKIIDEEQPKSRERRASDQLTTFEKPNKNNEILEFLKNEKKTHHNWIDQEIEHLKNLKLLLQNVNATESDESGESISEEKINSVYAKFQHKPKQNYFSIYENFRRNVKHTSGNRSRADVSSSIIDSSKSSDNSSRFLNRGKVGSKSNWIHRTTLESPPSTISSGSKVKCESRESMKQPAKSKEANRLPKWDSHWNMQQLVKNRTKLKTPNSDESIEAYAETCRAKFDRKCSETKSEYGKRIMSKTRFRDQPIYTKPYSSDTYSDIQNVKQSNGDRVNGKQSDAYTSMTGSDGFLSPNSISIGSIGAAANSASNTTTHQYDTKISVGLQTTDTLERMPIIQLKKPINEPKLEEPEAQERPTICVNKLTINKQLQVRPEALAYIITFEDDKDQNDKSNELQGQERGNQLYANAKKINSISSHVNSSSSSGDSNGESKRSGAKKQKSRFRGQTSSNSSPIESLDNLTLQECLQARRPDFYANAEQRRKCLFQMHNLRQQRNEQRKKLFAMNVCTNAKTLNRNMKRLLPPPPLAQIRIFKSREIVSQTRRKYQKLPEQKKRQQLERDVKIHRNHRILANMFNKNLQKRVLGGKTDLSNSMMIN
ncbi:formin-J-like [Sitodiplosis mosellana]|uniref:formin-J-like n=1 Tax=Sitodiplosis mosellana TaxID=263140 RepID=UPI002444C3AA|nr:formin-J-like [Sitodiplosis mosellana]